MALYDRDLQIGAGSNGTKMYKLPMSSTNLQVFQACFCVFLLLNLFSRLRTVRALQHCWVLPSTKIK